MRVGFMLDAMHSYSQHYEKSTPPRKGRLDTCLFAVTALKACLSTDTAAHVTDAFARHGASRTNAGINGGQDV